LDDPPYWRVHAHFNFVEIPFSNDAKSTPERDFAAATVTLAAREAEQSERASSPIVRKQNGRCIDPKLCNAGKTVPRKVMFTNATLAPERESHSSL